MAHGAWLNGSSSRCLDRNLPHLAILLTNQLHRFWSGSSLEGLGLCTQSGGYHGAVNCLDVWNFANHHRPVLLLRRERVDGVSEEKDGRQVGELGALSDLFPVLDLVVRDVKGGQLLERSHVVKSLNLVVGEPELLKSGGDIFQILNPLDVVAGEGQNFEILQTLHGHDLLN